MGGDRGRICRKIVYDLERPGAVSGPRVTPNSKS